jgi:ATP-dependent Zn protease
VSKTIEKQYVRALDILKKHKAKLDQLAKILLKQETMSIEEFVEIFEGKKKTKKK